MHKITKALTGAAATVALAGTFVVGPTIVASPSGTVGGVQVTQSADAASWIPTRPKTKQPVGWGSVCAIVTERGYWWGGTKRVEWRWFTTSLGGSTCYPYRTL